VQSPYFGVAGLKTVSKVPTVMRLRCAFGVALRSRTQGRERIRVFRNNRYPGKLIVFEGLDGSGQTTQAQLLAKWFHDKRSQLAYYTKEPTDGPVGGLLKLALSHRLVAMNDRNHGAPLDPATMALLFAADRVDHVRNDVIPKLEDGIQVLADRYYLSSLAYQSLELDNRWIREINRHAIKPDLTVFLDVPPRICVKRMASQRWHVEIYEDLSNLERVQQKYYEMINLLKIEGERIEVIDGNQPPADVHARVVGVCKDFLRAVANTEGEKTAAMQDQLSLLAQTSPLSKDEIATHQEG